MYRLIKYEWISKTSANDYTNTDQPTYIINAKRKFAGQFVTGREVHMGAPVGSGYGRAFAFIIVVFILLVIIGAAVVSPGGYGYY